MIAEMAFTFNPEKHEYRLGDLRLPSVTEILRGAGLIEGEFYTEVSRQRGKAVHLATALFDQGRLDWESLKATEEWLGEPIAPYVRGWEKFRQDTGFTPKLIEQAIFHREYLYAGMLDRVGVFRDGRAAIVDIKSGEPQAWCSMQLSAYLAALLSQDKEIGWMRRMAVQLTPDADYRIVPFTQDDDESAFFSALTLYRWRIAHAYA